MGSLRRPAAPNSPTRGGTYPAVGAADADPAFPFGRAAIVPHQPSPPRRQCAGCAGGGYINGVFHDECDGRGWHDAEHPAPGRPL